MDRSDRPNTTDILTDLDNEEVFLRKVADRCAYFSRTFSAYNERLAKAGLKEAFLNRHLLANAIESYFLDIKRLKDFHGMERADKFKIGGYTVKWLTKVKPIQVREPGRLATDLEKRMLVINEDFALIEALQIARVNYKTIPPRIVRGLLYSIHYRAMDPGVMAQFLEMASLAWP